MPTISRAAPARLHAGGDPRLLRPDRRGQVQQHGRHRHAGALPARGPEPARAARDGACCGRCKVVIDNYPEGQVEELEAVNNPEDPDAGTRKVPFSRELYIERDDFHGGPAEEVLPPGPGPRGAAALRLLHHLQRRGQGRTTGEVVELHCTYDPATRGGEAPDGRKVQGTLHWVSAAHAARGRGAALRPPVHAAPTPTTSRRARTGRTTSNPDSLRGAARLPGRAEPGRARRPATRYQFERQGYFCVDPGLPARRPGLQPHRHAARHLGQDREGPEGLTKKAVRTVKVRTAWFYLR